MSQPPPDWQPPEVFDEYRLLHSIGRGGMGQVYLAQDVLLDRPVAVKFIAAVEPDTLSRQRFLIEARAIARVQHPNVVSVYRVGEVDGHPYLVSEFVRGKSLNRLPKPMPWARVQRIGLGLSRGLAAAHRQGVLHRDIKPSNVMQTSDGDVKLLDFGLAKLLANLPQGESRDSAQLPAVPYPQPSPAAPVPSPAAQTPAVQLPPAPAPLRSSMFAETLVPGREEDSKATRPGETRPESSVTLTGKGAILGTPLYMATETLRGEPASRQSDVYSLGMVLYELCTGSPPRKVVADQANTLGHGDSRSGRSPSPPGPPVPFETPPLTDLVPGIDPGFAAIIERCLNQDPELRFASGDELRDALEQLNPDARLVPVPSGNPYRGLLAFEAEHRALFFGRGPEVRAIIERLRTEPMVLLAGDSGVGKSSLCRAGVLPAIAEGAIEEGRTFAIVRMVPGRHPLSALCQGVAPLLSLTEDALAERLRKEPTSLSRLLRKHRQSAPGTFLFIDQLEELCTQSDPPEAELLSRVLGTLCVPTPFIRVLLTARGDFLTRLAMLPGLGDEILRALYLLRPLSPEGIREAIVAPAQRKGVSFESEDLVRTLIESTTAAAGGLPLLQFALLELWENRDQERRLIPASALQAIGGVAGALSYHADGVISGLPPEQKLAARRILTRLVTVEGTRARRTEQELGRSDGATHAALEALIHSRLVVARQAEGETVYEVAHEALVRGWSTLQSWLDADVDRRAVRQRIEIAAAEWQRLGRSREALWSRRQLQEAALVDPAELQQHESEFLLASRVRSRGARLLRNGAAVGIPLLLLLFYGGMHYKAQRDLDRNVATYVGRAEAAHGEALRKGAQALQLREQAYALYDDVAAQALAQRPARDTSPSALLQKAERLYAQALSLDGEAEAAYVRASQQLETALTLDFTRARVRRLLGDITYERILLSERLYPDKQPDELLHRLANYDDDGSRRRRLSAPAHLHISPAPPQAHLLLQRYEDEGGYRRLSRVSELRSGDLWQAPGSYLLTFAAQGRALTRLPVLLSRGEEEHIALSLPPAWAVPDGFVYVPEGHFLFGSAGDDSVRKSFLNAPPRHQISTGAYLIARTEVTFADWLAFLRALPRNERHLRTPGISNLHGSLSLVQLPDGVFEITISPSAKAYSAREGEHIHYTSRSEHAVQDWLRFPVSAISLGDAEAYTEWLDRSGRVPGARLCTEQEWERAARGADGRSFPHGDRLSPADANYDETYGRERLSFGPDEVGSHPRSQSPFGVMDMAGNVWEWTRSARDRKEAVIRGGSWYHGDITNRSANRETVEPNLRDVLIGMRVCASVKVR